MTVNRSLAGVVVALAAAGMLAGCDNTDAGATPAPSVTDDHMMEDDAMMDDEKMAEPSDAMMDDEHMAEPSDDAMMDDDSMSEDK